MRALLVAIAALAIAATAAAGSRELRFATFNASLNRNATASSSRSSRPATTRRSATSPRSSSAPARTCCCINEFDFDARGEALRLFQRNYLSVIAERRARRSTSRTASRRRRTPGIPSGKDLDNNGRSSRSRVGPVRQRLVRLRRVPRPVRDGRLLAAPDRPQARPHVPDLPLEGHAGRPATGDPATRPVRLVLPTRSTSSGCRPRATGTCRSRRRGDACTSSSATRRRRCSTARRTATDAATSTRSASGPTTSRPARRGYIYDDAGRRGGLQPRRALRHRRRPELRPARRRQHPGRDPAAARQPARQREHDAREPRWARAGGAPGRRERDAPQRPGVRHGRLRRRRARATCAPTTSCPTADIGSDSVVFWPCTAIRCSGSSACSIRRCSRTATASRRPTTGSWPWTWSCPSARPPSRAARRR